MMSSKSDLAERLIMAYATIKKLEEHMEIAILKDKVREYQVCKTKE